MERTTSRIESIKPHELLNMAFTLKIMVSTKNGQDVEIEPAWWNIKELRRKYSFNKEVNQQYLDYILFVDKQTLKDIIVSQEKYRDQGVYNYEGWQKINAGTHEELQNLLNQLTENDQIKIRVYEWESGLD